MLDHCYETVDFISLHSYFKNHEDDLPTFLGESVEMDRFIRTVIGTDGYNMDLVSEIGAAGMVSKLQARDSGVARAGELVKAVTLDAAAALRRTDIGRLEKGARADLVAIDLATPHMQPVSDPLRAFVWRAGGRDVTATMVDGEFLVADGRYQLGDEAAITTAGVAAIEKVWKLPAAAEIFRRAEKVGGA